jgi:hypothetical protein
VQYGLVLYFLSADGRIRPSELGANLGASVPLDTDPRQFDSVPQASGLEQRMVTVTTRPVSSILILSSPTLLPLWTA